MILKFPNWCYMRFIGWSECDRVSFRSSPRKMISHRSDQEQLLIYFCWIALCRREVWTRISEKLGPRSLPMPLEDLRHCVDGRLIELARTFKWYLTRSRIRTSVRKTKINNLINLGVKRIFEEQALLWICWKILQFKLTYGFAERRLPLWSFFKTFLEEPLEPFEHSDSKLF